MRSAAWLTAWLSKAESMVIRRMTEVAGMASKKHEHAEYTVLLMTEIELVLPAHNETLERRRQVPKTHDGTSHLMEPTAASRARNDTWRQFCRPYWIG